MTQRQTRGVTHDRSRATRHDAVVSERHARRGARHFGAGVRAPAPPTRWRRPWRTGDAVWCASTFATGDAIAVDMSRLKRLDVLRGGILVRLHRRSHGRVLVFAFCAGWPSRVKSERLPYTSPAIIGRRPRCITPVIAQAWSHWRLVLSRAFKPASVAVEPGCRARREVNRVGQLQGLAPGSRRW